jgi:TetR/AcrR family transcriptional repressor of nem operon
MADAGLTHGGFYAHFRDKDELSTAAFQHASSEARERWFNALDDVPNEVLLRWLAGRYLTTAHRDDRARGCTFAALVGDAARRQGSLDAAFTDELKKTLSRLHDGGIDDDGALVFLALCIGGLTMARAVDDPQLSEQMLRACRTATGGSVDNIEIGRKQ